MENGSRTLLRSILKHEVWIKCACGHVGSVRVAALAEVKGDHASLADALGGVRCKACRCKRIADFWISYEGGSQAAMQGAEQGRPVGDDGVPVASVRLEEDGI